MNSVKNFVVWCWMALTLPYALVYLGLCGIRGGEWNSFLLQKMRREMFLSLTAPKLHYAVFVIMIAEMFFLQNVLSILANGITATWMFVLLYRIAPNTWAWYKIQQRIHATRSATGHDGCAPEAKANVKKLLMQLAAGVEWGFGDKPTPTSAVFEHAEWLARQLSFWKGERKSLFPEKN